MKNRKKISAAVLLAVIPCGRELHGDLIFQEVNVPAGEQLYVQRAVHRLRLFNAVFQDDDLLTQFVVLGGQRGNGLDGDTADDHSDKDCDDHELKKRTNKSSHGCSPFCVQMGSCL